MQHVNLCANLACFNFAGALFAVVGRFSFCYNEAGKKTRFMDAPARVREGGFAFALCCPGWRLPASGKERAHEIPY
jgi:hypothetical protein